MTEIEKILLTGATGRVGQKVVRDLVAKGVQVTVYVRNLAKSQEMFGTAPTVTHVEGDLSDLTPLQTALPGHSRLFLLTNDFGTMVTTKTRIAELAYAAGVRQIVDLSSRLVTLPWRTSAIGEAHRLAEENAYRLAIEHNAHFVSVRPSRFMSNQIFLDGPHIKAKQTIADHTPPDTPSEWVSPDDISDVITCILSDPIDKHASFAYPLIGDTVSGQARARLFSQVLGKPIHYNALSPKQHYDILAAHAPPALAFDLSSAVLDNPVTHVVPILLGRPNESMEQWLDRNKHFFTTS
ncbi:NAD(P)-binding protein [Hesseltinella vesiculosa]|uniref:NAD(P)-binding protein n=1 Tax=Hesseltinella vesiculosa TaxID=101127 RepID=A0A1X2GVJ0_9FUNG|nr:NAD(P)-binding protein [Hesseltinella vesiculosa]